ncbi:unnamed protein product [Closterium sp. NIES-65]|nr:unnamed protein product [Closterium sp. NIES-65]
MAGTPSPAKSRPATTDASRYRNMTAGSPSLHHRTPHSPEGPSSLPPDQQQQQPQPFYLHQQQQQQQQHHSQQEQQQHKLERQEHQFHQSRQSHTMEHLHRPTRSHPFLHSSTSRSLFHSPRREGAAAQESGSLTGEGRERAAVQEQSSTQSSEGSEVAAACEGRRTLSCEGRAGAAAREESSQPMAGQSAAALARGGWGAALQNQYARKVDVVLRGYSGYNTRWALFLLPKLFPKGDTSIPPPALVTVFFGANDAALPGRMSGKQHVPIPEFKENLRVIVTHLQSLGPNVRVVLITPPPVDEPGRMEFANPTLSPPFLGAMYGEQCMNEGAGASLQQPSLKPGSQCMKEAERTNEVTGASMRQREMYGEQCMKEPERTNEFTGKYAGAVREVAEACGGVPVIDLWTVLQQQPTWQALLSDGLHLAPGGNKVLFEQLSSLLQSSADWTPPLVQESMPWDFPEHINIDGENPGNAFKDF